MTNRNIGICTAVCVVCCIICLVTNMTSTLRKRPSQTRIAEKAFLRAFKKDWPKCEVSKLVISQCKDPTLFRGFLSFYCETGYLNCPLGNDRYLSQKCEASPPFGHNHEEAYVVVKSSGNGQCLYQVFSNYKDYDGHERQVGRRTLLDF